MEEYDQVIVAFSGGKDSTAAVVKLLEMGVPREKLVLWHHDVDGGRAFMDWPVTRGYCAAFGQAMALGVRFSWREGGFEREMLRDQSPTAPVTFESHGGTTVTVGGTGPEGTRLKFPQVSADLKVRWCSAYLKIDVARRVFSNDPRYERGRFLFVTGERREESTARSNYAEIEEHSSTNQKRRVDQWRAVIDWKETEVWDALRRWRIRPHPAYYLGWGRVSCALCIFGDPDQWASAKALMPNAFNRVAEYERRFGVTIKRGMTVEQLAAKGESFLPDDPDLAALALSHGYDPRKVLVPESEEWVLPAGAYKRAGGPT